MSCLTAVCLQSGDGFISPPFISGVSDKYCMILWIKKGLQSVALAFTGTRGLPWWYDLAMGRVGVALSSFLRVKDTLIPNIHDVFEFCSQMLYH